MDITFSRYANFLLGERTKRRFDNYYNYYMISAGESLKLVIPNNRCNPVQLNTSTFARP